MTSISRKRTHEELGMAQGGLHTTSCPSSLAELTLDGLLIELKEWVFDRIDDPTSFYHLCLVSRSWASVGRAAGLQARAKDRFTRPSAITTYRSTQWDVELLTWRLPNGRPHGPERVAITPHRVGGSGCQVYYAERVWVDGALDGDEIMWEINAAQRRCAGSVYRTHPYSGIDAVLAWQADPNHAAEAAAAAKAYNSGPIAEQTAMTMATEGGEVVDDRQAEARAQLGRWARWGVVVLWRRWAASELVWHEELLEEMLDAYGVSGALEPVEQ
ncbi:uncharacterized protein ACA1_062170 [Acanthamoeba castellanii str. Neff]|uniref:Uncharacterized protein n=1 Tax=Acanthamoeba castellanii (strain ATCC 30010 / Neff) TaxID=1257118 RepID=L8GWU9_ACACF|nr:uncharacterized protein ACA1_062170 [Acanthamoeba castellanii str. Neff]ELR17475.1 hypothetical protein ACA1_062170 [Acanthamoeba castellanii str. Neff]